MRPTPDDPRGELIVNDVQYLLRNSPAVASAVGAMSVGLQLHAVATAILRQLLEEQWQTDTPVEAIVAFCDATANDSVATGSLSTLSTMLEEALKFIRTVVDASTTDNKEQKNGEDG